MHSASNFFLLENVSSRTAFLPRVAGDSPRVAGDSPKLLDTLEEAQRSDGSAMDVILAANKNSEFMLTSVFMLIEIMSYLLFCVLVVVRSYQN